jgi:3-hydroxyacyl-[acyl-carrier-protein] dehydratase
MRFLLIDKIIDLVPGKQARAVKYISENEDYFRDHFPGFPVVPGVLLTEMMAQAAGKCLNAERYGKEYAMLAQINSAKFYKWVRPGSEVLIIVNIKNNKPRFATAECKAKVENETVASSDLFFSFVEGENFSEGYHDTVLDAYLGKAGPRKKESDGK